MDSDGMEVDIKVSETGFWINSFHTTDNDIIQYFSAVREERREITLETVIKTGVIALRSIATSEKVDYIERSFSAMLGDIRHEMERKFGTEGEVRNLIEGYFGERGVLAGFLDAKIGKNGEFLKLVNDLVGPNGEVIRNVFDPGRPGSPLHSLRKEILDSLNEMKSKIAVNEEVQKVKERTPLKGIEFQEQVGSLLAAIARPLGDEISDLTSTPGRITSSKKGDFTARIGSENLQIVIEAKDSPFRTVKKIRDEMKEAMENRSAAYGIFVSRAVEGLPDETGWFNEYDNSFLAVALTSETSEMINQNLMEIAYKWARLRALSSIASGAVMKPLDLGEKLSTIKVSIDRFRNIRTKSTDIEKAVKSIREEVDEIEKQVIASLREIQDEIALS